MGRHPINYARPQKLADNDELRRLVNEQAERIQELEAALGTMVMMVKQGEWYGIKLLYATEGVSLRDKNLKEFSELLAKGKPS